MMRKGKFLLMQVAVFALAVMASSTAYASLSAPEYIWSATGGSGGSTVYSYSLTLGGDMQAGNTFSMYDWGNTNNSLLLVDPANSLFFAPVTITLSGGVYTAANSQGSLTLGDSSQFGFSFSNSTGTYLTYTLSQIAANSWQLAGPTGSIINVQGNVTPSAVPIPGSLLLFGAGLLGLWGIGSRRNKAQLA